VRVTLCLSSFSPPQLLSSPLLFALALPPLSKCIREQDCSQYLCTTETRRGVFPPSLLPLIPCFVVFLFPVMEAKQFLVKGDVVWSPCLFLPDDIKQRLVLPVFPPSHSFKFSPLPKGGLLLMLYGPAVPFFRAPAGIASR